MRNIAGIADPDLQRKQLVAYEMIETLCRMKKILDNPKNNVNEYKNTNEYRRDVTTVRACCELLSLKPVQLEDDLDQWVIRLTKAPIHTLIPSREIILPGAVDPSRLKR